MEQSGSDSNILAIDFLGLDEIDQSILPVPPLSPQQSRIVPVLPQLSSKNGGSSREYRPGKPDLQVQSRKTPQPGQVLSHVRESMIA